MILRNGKFSGKKMRTIFRTGKFSMGNFPPHITTVTASQPTRSIKQTPFRSMQNKVIVLPIIIQQLDERMPRHYFCWSVQGARETVGLDLTHTCYLPIPLSDILSSTPLMAS
jgi:hypothetical protein